MNILLDTHLLIWAVSSPDKLSVEAKRLISGAARIYVSAASIWEMGIKIRLGKLAVDLDRLLRQLQEMGVEELPVRWEHSRLVGELPLYHRDPFDRLLVAQAISEPLILLTRDAVLPKYHDVVRLV